MQLTETKTGLKGRARSIVRARQSFNAALPREGRIARQCRRCFVAYNQVAHVHQLRAGVIPANRVSTGTIGRSRVHCAGSVRSGVSMKTKWLKPGIRGLTGNPRLLINYTATVNM